MEPGSALRVGVIGCGQFASGTIWPCLRYAPVEVVYACARHLESAEDARKRFGAERATADSNELLEDDSIDAIFVLGPPDLHYDIGLRVLEARKHLFVEKPPAPTVEQAVILEAAARASNVQCQVEFQKRFALGYGLACEAARRPEFGGLRICKINYSHWRMESWPAHLNIMSVHTIDLVGAAACSGPGVAV